MKRLRDFNENFFEIPNLLNSYWAGFIAADGYISSYEKRKRLEINLAIKDFEHLQKFANDLEFQRKLEVGKNRKECRIRLTSPKLIEDLERNFGIKTQKSLTLLPPNLDNTFLIESFIVGLIDGDGSIIFNKKHGFGVYLVGTKEICEWVWKFYVKLTRKENFGKLYFPYKNNFCSMRVYGKKANVILEHLKKIDVPKLERKWGRFVNG